jgi:hypothetical protein
MQIHGEYIENMLVNMELNLFYKKKTLIQKKPFHVSSFANGLNIFHFGIVQVMTYDLQLMEFKVVMP